MDFPIPAKEEIVLLFCGSYYILYFAPNNTSFFGVF